MDKEFKIKFTLNTDDAEKQASSFKNKMQKNEKVKLDVELGNTDKELKSLFSNVNSLSRQVNKNLFWSKEKKREFEGFFSSMSKTAYSALKQIEAKYENLGQQVDLLNSKRVEIKTEIANKDALADDLMRQIQEEMDKANVNIGNQDDYNNLVAEYQKAQSIAYSAQSKLRSALKEGDTEAVDALKGLVEKYNAARDEVADRLNNFQFGSAEDVVINDKVKDLQLQYQQATKDAEKLDEELQKFDKNGAIRNKTAEMQDLKNEFHNIVTDLQGNPLQDGFKSDTLKKQSLDVQNLNAGLKRSGALMTANSKIGEFWQRTMQRMKFSIYSMLNPLNIARKVWSNFKEQNTEVANTFTMIGNNFVRILTPAINGIVNLLLQGIGYLDVFVQGIQKAFGVQKPISLFDKKGLDATDKTVDKVEKFTAGFDELHMFDTEKADKKASAKVTLDVPELNIGWTKNLMKWGEGFGKALKFVCDNWKWLAAAFAAFKIGQGLWNLYKLFGGTGGGLLSGIKTVGSAFANFFGKTLYTGANGAAVSIGKFVAGTALLVGGTTLAITEGKKLGANWQDLSTKQKVVGVGMAGLGSAAAGLGAVMLGASGPVGWAVAGVVALTAFTVGMAQTQDGIDSVKKETEKLAEAQNNAKIANDNYLTAVNNLSNTMSNLEQLEKQTGLSGAELDAQVRSGKLEVDKMTTAQLQVYNAYLQNEEMIKQLKEATEQKKEADKQAVIQTLRTEAANATSAKSYDKLREQVVKAWQDGSISAEEGADIMSRALANADDETQKTFGESIPNEMKNAFNPDQYESGWRKFGNSFKNMMGDLGKWFSEKWSGLKSWWNGLWNKNSLNTNLDTNIKVASVNGVPSYDVGTNYVPNDQLAMVHKGEAIIPAKYNKPQSSSDNTQLTQTLNAMNTEIANLRSTIAQGIPVSGEFRQRGNDLVAVVDRTKSRNGSQPLSNPAYAR